MSREVEFIAPGATIQQAAERMGELDTGAMPVGSPERLEGILTDRDILYRVIAGGLDSRAARVGEVMSSMVFSCREDDTLQAAMELMSAHSVRRLPVIDAEGRVSGWLTLNDVAHRLLVDSQVMQRALQELAPAAG